MDQLHAALRREGSAVLGQTQAISGLGGIGKTQTAVEYAYRHRDVYAAVFWIRAETVAEAQAGFVEVARLVGLPEASLDDQGLAVQAARRWLAEHDDWLLVFDNADRPQDLRELLPEPSRGHIVLTSRAQVFDSLGIRMPFRMSTLPPGEAIVFLLERACREVTATDEHSAAAELAVELGCLPLALEQAGAYIAAKQVPFTDYLASYRGHRFGILEKARPVAGGYSESVGTTWALNFAAVEQASPAATDVLRASAFLAPDAIPLELLDGSAGELGPTVAEAISGDPLAVVEVLEPLTRFSLIGRDVEARTYSVHRLVQAAVRGGMESGAERRWAARVVRALARVFPETEFEMWPKCERLARHTAVAALLIKEHGFEFRETGDLLGAASTYARLRGRYQEAERLGRGALEIREKSCGPVHLDVAECLNRLGLVLSEDGRYAEAESTLRRSLDIRERRLGREHLDVAQVLGNLGGVYWRMGRFDEAVSFHLQAFDTTEKQLGSEHPRTARHLDNLGTAYAYQGLYTEAKMQHLRAYDIRVKAYGAQHPEVGMSLNNLAYAHWCCHEYAEAEPIFRQALEIREGQLGAEHPDVAQGLNNLAHVLYRQGNYSEAEPLFCRALKIRERVLNPKHREIAQALNNLANLYHKQGRYSEAEPLHHRALAIYEAALGEEHADVADPLLSLANLHRDRGEYATAGPFYERAYRSRENALGPEHPLVAEILEEHAELLRHLDENDRARAMEERARTIRQKTT